MRLLSWPIPELGRGVTARDVDSGMGKGTVFRAFRKRSNYLGPWCRNRSFSVQDLKIPRCAMDSAGSLHKRAVAVDLGCTVLLHKDPVRSDLCLLGALADPNPPLHFD